MTTADVIPVLKALYHNPTCHEPMSDWFEEQGDLSTALRLRDQAACEMVNRWVRKAKVGEIANPSHLVLRHISRRDGEFRPNPVVREALIVEAMSRMTIGEANQDHTDRMTRDHLRYHLTLGYQTPLGGPLPRTNQWFRFKPHLCQTSVRLRHFPSLKSVVAENQVTVSVTGDEVVDLSVIKLFGWEGVNLTHTLCGGWLTFTAHVLVGRSEILGVPVVSELTPDVLTNPSLMQL